MALSRSTQNGEAKNAPGFKLFINDEVITEAIPVLGIAIYRSFNRITTAKLIIKDGKIGGGQTQKTDFPLQNKTIFQPGNTIEIKIGHGGDTQYSAFKGVITNLGIRIRQASSKLIVECKSAAFRMTLQPKSAYYTESSDSDIINTLLQEYDLANDVEDNQYQHQELVQYECTDWRFMVNRAEHSGLFVLIDEADRVKVKALDLQQEPRDILEYGHNIYELDAEIDSRLQFEGVTIQSWDFTQQVVLEQEAIPPILNAQGNLSGDELAKVGKDGNKAIRHSGFKPDAELQAKADAVLLRDRIAKICGRARIKTVGKITPGDLFDLRSVGQRFSGLALVSAVRYEYSGESWMADVQFGFSNLWKLEQDEPTLPSTSSAFVPGVSGLQIGLVSQIHNDPAVSNRIKVRLPLLDITAEGIWARIAALDAGANRGSFFMPEVNDEVIVGFINEDPNDAVVLGMLHSSANPPRLAATEENNQKGFFSREGISIIFNEEKKTLTLETPGRNKLVLNDEENMVSLECSNGNKLEISAENGVKLGNMNGNTKILGAKIDLNE